MPDILPTINNEPPQGIQALLDTVYLWNPDVANDLIEKINELLGKIDNVSGKIPPYSELVAPVLQYMPCYDGDNVYVAAQDLDELPGTLDPSQWILIATKAPVLQAGTGISIDGNEISVTQAISDGAAAGSTAVQPNDLGTAAYAATTDFATAAQGSLADSAVQPGDLGTAAYAASSDFATAVQGAKADTAVQPGDLGTAAYASTSDFATAAQGGKADTAVQPGDLGTAAYAATTDFATASQGAKADTAIQSVKTINGNDIVGTGNLVITSFAVYPASWPTTGTTKAFCDAIAADDTAVEGMTYLGEVTLTDMPNGIANSEIQVEIMSGSSAYNKIILLTLTSGNVAPYRWQYTYWNAGTNVSGWINIGQQVNVDWNSSSGVTQILNKPAIPTVVDDYNSTSGTAALSANMGHDLNERLSSVEGRGRFLSTWNCTTGLAGTNPPTSPYTYNSGDYFIVSAVGATNYRPSGSQYVTGTASSVVETGSVAVNDTYQYDGTNWVLLKNTVEDPLPSQTGNNGKYLTTDGTAASWAAISFPVSSVNSQTGAVTLTATDVGALPSSTVIPSTAIDVNAVPQLSTLPTADLAHEGQVVQFVGTTGTYTNGYFYKCVSDGDVSNPTFSWVRVDVQPAPVIPDPLPSQTGNSGKFLTTNGTAASWDKAIPNKATATTSFSTGSSTATFVTAIGASQTVDVNRGTAFGAENRIYDSESTAIGDYIQIWGTRSFGAGVDVIINGYSSIAIGPAAQARANVAIQLGGGTNSTANSMQVWTYQLLDKTTGLIPEARLADTTSATAGQALVLDSNLKAAWTTVDSLPTQTGHSGEFLTTNGTAASWGTVDALPSQTGQSGKFLTTDGTDASWATINALQNTATGSGSIATGNYSQCTKGSCVVIGGYAKTDRDYGANGSVVIGWEAEDTKSGYSLPSVVIGYKSKVTGPTNKLSPASCAIGVQAESNASVGTVLGGVRNKVTGDFAIQIGGFAQTNSEAGTLYIGSYYNNTTVNYKLLDADGTIPTDRFTTTPVADGTYVPTLTIASGVATRSWAAPGGGGSTALSLTLAAANWSNNSITVTATGVTASNNVIVSPAPASQSAYTTAGVMCTAQAANSLTFTCTTTPSSDLTVTVLII